MRINYKIVGIGDYGCQVLKDLSAASIPAPQCLAMNTDWAFAPKGVGFLKIGTKSTLGMGAGALAHVGEKAAKEDEKAIENSIKGCEILIIVAALGGGTGSGASSVVAQIAKKLGIATIAFVTLPPQLEGKFRCKTAQEAVEKLKVAVDALFALSIDEIESPDAISSATIVQSYKKMDKILQTNILQLIDFLNSQLFMGKTVKDVLNLVKHKKISTN